MRLLNIYTLELTEFYETALPLYFILSHRWEGKEITYKDFVKRRSVDTKGYQKVLELCAFARLQDEGTAAREIHGAARIEWAWIDTCCIDKRSSAELSEAINSMFRWYEKATACFVYLNDVPAGTSDEEQRKAIIASSWFHRCWTLQELLAPPRLIFCDSSWSVLGCIYRSDPCLWLYPSHQTSFEAHYGPPLTKLVSRITRISASYFEAKHRFDLSSVSIAERMTWASRRQASRIEDEAYSLLGIFGINMPLLYGEGPKAFMRLQHEIIKQSTDDSIFAWTLAPGVGTSCEGMFATSANLFKHNTGYGLPPYHSNIMPSITSRGLYIRARTVKVSHVEFTQKIRGIKGTSVVEPSGDVFFLLMNDTTGRLPLLDFTLALAERRDCPLEKQFQRICTDDFGGKFMDLFNLADREFETTQSFYIDV